MRLRCAGQFLRSVCAIQVRFWGLSTLYTSIFGVYVQVKFGSVYAMQVTLGSVYVMQVNFCGPSPYAGQILRSAYAPEVKFWMRLRYTCQFLGSVYALQFKFGVHVRCAGQILGGFAKHHQKTAK